ncbi:MAG: DegT/DnrJ/EryC1/StrS family aminotransferase [Hyphomicrobiaceae bacterium]|nr:DegT/DnrJ/EryC1/StrS family aminotransferase [Hyphomicrobiaceae bacterium]
MASSALQNTIENNKSDIRLAIPDIDESDIEAVSVALRSGWLVQGANVAAFETELAKLLNQPYCVAVTSGTAALHASLIALGIQPGDIVIAPSFSWPATANVIDAIGAMTVFADIDSRTLSITPQTLEAAIRIAKVEYADREIKAAIVVHPFGAIGCVDEIKKVCDENNLPLVEDAACAIGSSYDGKPAGSWGEIACLSFHPRKVVTTGEGGALLVRDKALARQLGAFRNHGLDPSVDQPTFYLPGLNYRMTEMQAACGCTQLAKLDRLIKVRRKKATLYKKLLESTGVQTQQFDAKRCQPNYQAYIVSLPDGFSAHNVIPLMRARGIETSIGTWHIPLTAYFRGHYGYREGDFPGTDAAFSSTMALPLHTGLTEDDQNRVIDTLIRLVS